MSTSGSGVGTPIATPESASVVYDQQEELVTTPNCAVSLARYAKIINYEEASFWGVIWDNQFQRGCDPLWSEYQRMSMANALAEAQQEIEQVIGYPLCPTYITGTYADNPRWFDQQKFKSSRTVTRYPRILAAGAGVTEIVEAGSTVDYGITTGVGVVGPIATNAENSYEIKIFYPDSDRQITPSKITLSSGTVTIEIPRYRMVQQEFLNDNDNSIRYENINFFLSEVDVRRVYTDLSNQATLVRPGCRNNTCAGGCSECTTTACMYVRDPHLGVVDLVPATWDSELADWSSRTVCVGNYSIVRLNYLAGIRTLDLQAEMTIIRLAHAKMGRPPCHCDKTGEMWQRDYDVTGAVTRERVNCPFGLSNGAWHAYKWAMSMKAMRASIF
jgi:hypothetical protein